VRRAVYVVDGDEPRGVVGAPEGGDTVAQRRRGGERQGFASIVAQGQSQIAAQKRHRRHGVEHAAPFAARAAQEFLPRGRIVEQPPHVDGGAPTTCDLVDRLHGATGRDDACPHAVGVGGLDLEL